MSLYADAIKSVRQTLGAHHPACAVCQACEWHVGHPDPDQATPTKETLDCSAPRYVAAVCGSCGYTLQFRTSALLCAWHISGRDPDEAVL